MDLLNEIKKTKSFFKNLKIYKLFPDSSGNINEMLISLVVDPNTEAVECERIVNFSGNCGNVLYVISVSRSSDFWYPTFKVQLRPSETITTARLFYLDEKSGTKQLIKQIENPKSEIKFFDDVVIPTTPYGTYLFEVDIKNSVNSDNRQCSYVHGICNIEKRKELLELIKN